MSHYICTGDCEGVSAHPQNCAAESCSKFDQPLFRCNCKDKGHKLALK